MIFKVISMIEKGSGVHGILREDHPLVDMHDFLCSSVNQLVLLHELTAMVDKALVIVTLMLVLWRLHMNISLMLCERRLCLLQGMSLFLS